MAVNRVVVRSAVDSRGVAIVMIVSSPAAWQPTTLVAFILERGGRLVSLSAPSHLQPIVLLGTG